LALSYTALLTYPDFFNYQQVSQLSQLKKWAVVTDANLETIIIKGFRASVTTVTTVTGIFINIYKKKFFFGIEKIYRVLTANYRY